MHIRCWQCGEDVDAQAAEREIYLSLIRNLRDKMCSNTSDDVCNLEWRHEDCRVLGELIKDLKEKL